MIEQIIKPLGKVARVTKTIHTETGHRLLGYEGLCSNLHGHSYRWDITIEGGVDKTTGFVMDFKELKGILTTQIGVFDHALVLNHKDELLQHLKKFCLSTRQRLIVMEQNPTVENMILYVLPKLKIHFCGKAPRIKMIRCQETVDSYAEVVL